jgi:hypothetical protein
MEDIKPPLVDTVTSADRAEHAKMRGLVIELCSAIHQYRFAHDNYGGDDIRTGRAWDLMRRTQQKAQSSFDPMGALFASVETPDPYHQFPTRFT